MYESFKEQYAPYPKKKGKKVFDLKRGDFCKELMNG